LLLLNRGRATGALDEVEMETWQKAYLQSREEALKNGAPIPKAEPSEKMQIVYFL